MTVAAERESRRERRARETRRKILMAAYALFQERGVDTVTVEEIAERADVARATVFNHFATKDNLCQEMGELQLEALEEAIRQGRVAGPSAGEKIEQALRVIWEALETPGASPEIFRQILLRVLATISPGVVPEHRVRLCQHFEAWVAEGQRRGEFRSDVPASELACFLLGLQFQATLAWAYGFIPTTDTLMDCQLRVLRLALEGVQQRSAEPGA